MGQGDGKRGQKSADAAPVGTWLPGGDLGGSDRTGRVDVPYGLSATRRAHGDHLVQVEEDLYDKGLLHRRTP